MPRRRPGRPVWTRLVLLIPVPLAGIGLVATPSINERRAVASGSQETERRVATLNSMLELRYALTTELVPMEAVIRAGKWGVGIAQASTLLGFDLSSRLASSQLAVDQLLATIPSPAPPIVEQVRVFVRSARTAVDAGTADIEAIHRTYSDAMDELTDLASTELVAIISNASTSAGQAQGVEAAAHRLVDAFELVRAGTAEVESLFQLMVLSSPTDFMAIRDDLVGLRAMYRERLLEIQRDHSPGIAAMVAAIVSNPDVASFDEALGRQVAQTPAGPLELTKLAGIFRSSFARMDLFRDLLRVATGDATGVAHQRQEEATQRLHDEVLMIAIIVLATSASAMAIAWSITRRLRRLAAHASQVSEGVLDGPRATERGPREIGVVARALNDTVANLQQIQSQATALANGDLDDQSLARPAAGMLGASIHATVQRLSQAWREGDQLRQRLAHQAAHDLLTGLPNRKAALEALDLALARAGRHEEITAVLFVDLDDFKRANDNHGHHIGDRVLRACADRLAATTRAGDHLARLGGDEFLVIAERVGSTQEAIELAERLILAVSQPIVIDGITARVGASVGIGVCVDHDVTGPELLRDADNAVHYAKRSGKGRVEIFDERARLEMAAQADIEEALRSAVADGDLYLQYQPVTDATNGELRGFEALARWRRDGPQCPSGRLHPGRRAVGSRRPPRSLGAACGDGTARGVERGRALRRRVRRRQRLWPPPAG